MIIMMNTMIIISYTHTLPSLLFYQIKALKDDDSNEDKSDDYDYDYNYIR